MKMFDSRKTTLRVADLLNTMTGGQRRKFSTAAKKLFDKKVTADEGVYDSFQITNSDIPALVAASKN